MFRRIRFGSDERKKRGAVRRSNQNKATTLTIVVIHDQAKSKLVEVESKASILITDEDRNVMKAEVGCWFALLLLFTGRNSADALLRITLFGCIRRARTLQPAIPGRPLRPTRL